MRTKYITCMALVATFICCTEEAYKDNDLGTQHLIRLQPVYPCVESDTRAVMDGGFVSGDVMGIFLPGKASNIPFVLAEDGTWSGPGPLYWDEQGTPVDIYGYYPYSDNISLEGDNAFAVSRRQDAAATSTAASGYAASDMLIAKALSVSPTNEPIVLRYQHVMAGITVHLEMGDGFTPDEWAAMEKNVLIGNMKLEGTVNLMTDEVQVSSSAESQAVVPLLHNGAWRAVTYPQTVDAGKTLVAVTVDGQSYALKKDAAMNFLSGKMHTFTITVDRREAGGQFAFSFSDEAITPWTDDLQLHEGLVRKYIVVNVPEAGELSKVLADMGLDYRNIQSLKVLGVIGRKDLEFMGQQMEGLENLNLLDVTVSDGVLTGFNRHPNLTHLTMPYQGLRIIEEGAFLRTHLTGSLIIPEGVESIKTEAFWSCEFVGSLSLPSTLRHIGDRAIYGNFTGELFLPDELESIGSQGIDGYNGKYFTGTLTIPPKLTSFPLGGYWRRMTGNIVLPQGFKIIDGRAFAFSSFDGNVVLPEGLEIIAELVFNGTPICGEVRLPSTLTALGTAAFRDTRISKVIFPDNLEFMGIECFAESRISGSVTWPHKLERVPEATFFGCNLLEEIVLHENVTIVDDRAFEACPNLLSVVCAATEPPLVGTDAFLGVPLGDATLRVPPGCVERYRNADGWRSFRNIVVDGNLYTSSPVVMALNKGISESLVVYSDGEWEVTHKPDWCSLSATSAFGKKEIMVTIDPLPHGSGARKDSIVIASSTLDSKGQKVGLSTYCTVLQEDYQYEMDSYLTLNTHSKGAGINLVFVGDGFTASDIASDEYLELIRYQVECFFSIEPYRSMRDYFNVYVTFPLSQEQGINTMYTYVNNRFGTLQGQSELAGLCGSGQMLTESDEVLKYVLKNAPVSDQYRTLIVLVPNTTDYAGNTILDYDEYDNIVGSIALCPPSARPYPQDTRGIIQHEAGGHAFALLGDEGISQNGYAPSHVINEIERGHWKGLYPNLATTGKLSNVPWADFIFNPAYSSRVDVFEGGWGYTRGIYRPEANSCMNYGIPYYNTPSRLSIYRRIKALSGESPSLEEFYRQDTFDWGPTDIASPLATRAGAMDTSKMAPYSCKNHLGITTIDFNHLGNEVRRIRAKLKKERMNEIR